MKKIKGISCDSRKINNGYIFVAIQGLKDDGNNYINEAINNGAQLIITDQQHKNLQDIKVPVLIVDNARKYLAKLTADFYNNPSQKLNIIGVTGTNGKTTTTHLIYNLLNEQKKQAGIIGTVSVDNGNKLKKGHLTTPDTEQLQRLFSRMLSNNLKYCSMEVSSHGIKLMRTASTHFSFKIATNITADHLDLHQSIKKYINVKKSFLRDENNVPVLINKDDKILSSLGKVAKNQLNYSINKNTIIKAENINYKDNKIKFTYSLKKSLYSNNNKIKPIDFEIIMNLSGKHNIYNSLAAITVALYYGIHPETIQHFFVKYKGLWRRFQKIYDKDFLVIDDCAHNPGSYEAVFSTIRKMNYNNLYIINAIRGNRGVAINKENAAVIATSLKNIENNNLIITECKDLAKKDDLVTKREKENFLKILNDYNQKNIYYNNFKKAISDTLNKVQKNDIILLLGAHAMDKAGQITLKLLNHNNQEKSNTFYIK